MKKRGIFLLILVLLVVAVAWGRREFSDATARHGETGMQTFGVTNSPPGITNRPPRPPAILYSCPMHPEIVQDKPGYCPKCGMKLVPKK